MTYALKFSGAGLIIRPGTGGQFSDLKAVYEGDVWSDTAEVQRMFLGEGITVSAVTVIGFSCTVANTSNLSVVASEGTLTFAGVHDSAFLLNYWTSRDDEPTLAFTVTQGLNWPVTYHAGYKYQPDATQYTSVTWTVVTNLGTFTSITQIVRNDWSKKRDYIRPFVAQGTMETINGVAVTRYMGAGTTSALSAATFSVLNTVTAALITVTFAEDHGLTTGDAIFVDVTSTATNHTLAEGYFNLASIPSSQVITYYASAYGNISLHPMLGNVVKYTY